MSGGVWGRYLPGEVGEVRVWAGAMNGRQVESQVLGIPSAVGDDQ